MLWPPRLLADCAELPLIPAPPKALLLEPKPEPDETLRLPTLFPPPPKPELIPVLGRAPTLAPPPPGRFPAPAPEPSPVPLPGRLLAPILPAPAPAPSPPLGRLPAPLFPVPPPAGRLSV